MAANGLCVQRRCVYLVLIVATEFQFCEQGCSVLDVATQNTKSVRFVIKDCDVSDANSSNPMFHYNSNLRIASGTLKRTQQGWASLRKTILNSFCGTGSPVPIMCHICGVLDPLRAAGSSNVDSRALQRQSQNMNEQVRVVRLHTSDSCNEVGLLLVFEHNKKVQ